MDFAFESKLKPFVKALAEALGEDYKRWEFRFGFSNDGEWFDYVEISFPGQHMPVFEKDGQLVCCYMADDGARNEVSCATFAQIATDIKNYRLWAKILRNKWKTEGFGKE